MAINTAERRKSALEFGKGARGTGLPIPLGTIPVASRAHVLNLYSGNPPPIVPSFFWRHRGIVSSLWRNRSTPLDGSTQ